MLPFIPSFSHVLSTPSNTINHSNLSNPLTWLPQSNYYSHRKIIIRVRGYHFLESSYCFCGHIYSTSRENTLNRLESIIITSIILGTMPILYCKVNSRLGDEEVQSAKEWGWRLRRAVGHVTLIWLGENHLKAARHKWSLCVLDLNTHSIYLNVFQQNSYTYWLLFVRFS